MQLTLSILFFLATTTNGWEAFEKTKFKWLYSEEYESHIEIPYFDSGVKKLENTEITLTGHYIPMVIDSKTIILSKNPYASCFFCGGAGPESVAEVIFKEDTDSFEADEIITIKGKLKLNKWDYDHMVFMVIDAEVVD